MTVGDLEQKIQELEEKYGREIERLQAVRECERLVGRYAYLHAKHRREELVQMYALKTPGVRVQLGDMGVWEGPEGVRKAWVGMGNLNRQDIAIGQMFLHPLTTQYIEVAGDGQTAKGVWMSPGFIAGNMGENRTPMGIWAWGAIGVDFVKEDGQWKFWHFHIYSLASAPFGGKALRAEPGGSPELPDEIKPDRPPVDNCPYDPNKAFNFKPEPPEPYETFDERTAY